MRKICSSLLAIMILIGCFCNNARATTEVTETITEYDIAQSSIMRATGSFNFSVAANRTTVADKEFPLSSGETVRIRATYDPASANLDFGLVDSNNVFHYISVNEGSIDKTIKVSESDNYRLAVRNNSKTTVKVSGFVNY